MADETPRQEYGLYLVPSLSLANKANPVLEEINSFYEAAPSVTPDADFLIWGGLFHVTLMSFRPMSQGSLVAYRNLVVDNVQALHARGEGWRIASDAPALVSRPDIVLVGFDSAQLASLLARVASGMAGLVSNLRPRDKFHATLANGDTATLWDTMSKGPLLAGALMGEGAWRPLFCAIEWDMCFVCFDKRFEKPLQGWKTLCRLPLSQRYSPVPREWLSGDVPRHALPALAARDLADGADLAALGLEEADASSVYLDLRNASLKHSLAGLVARELDPALQQTNRHQLTRGQRTLAQRFEPLAAEATAEVPSTPAAGSNAGTVAAMDL